jgi:opacity protein-like surface antigen
MIRVMLNFEKASILLICIFAIGLSSNAQYAERKFSKKRQAYIDSLKAVEYNHVFPILGQQVYKRGFDIPYPVGLMANYIWMDQGIVIDNLQLGFQNEGNNVPLTPIDFVEFGDNRNTSYSLNFRPDIWILPFLNVYGLFGYGASTTEVKLTVPVEMTSIVTQNMSTTGFGVMAGFGLGPVWASVDANWTWTNPELLDDPVLVKVLGVRIGKTFTFKHKPERNVAFWIGGMRVQMDSETFGAILMKDAIPQEVWDRKDQIVQEYADWRDANYDNLTPKQKGVVNTVIDPIVESLDQRDGNSVISYGMDKSPKEKWNFLIGGQFQLNKRWMLRSEAGFIGDRKSFLASFNYRFML